MKTLLFTLEYQPFKGGIANYYSNIAKYWPIGESISVLDNSREELVIKERGYFSWWPAIFNLKRKIKKGKIDYVLVGQILPLGTVACFWSYFQPLKYAVFLHGMDLAYALKIGRKKWLAKIILNRAHKIIAANSYVADRVKEIDPFLESKLVIVNPGIESGAPAADQNEILEIKKRYNLEGKIVLFTLGRLVRRKGIDWTIKALTEIPEPLINKLTYFIAGTGPREEFLKKLVPLRFAKKIIFLGEITDEEKWAWFNLCDIFVMPSRDIQGDFEGFGIVYLEANLFGKPVIAGSSGGVKDAVRDGYNGLVVNSESVEEIKKGIIKLAVDPGLRQQLGEQGKSRAVKEFNWEKQVEKITQAIKKD